MTVKSVLNKLLLAGTAALGISSAYAETPAPQIPDGHINGITAANRPEQTKCENNYWADGKTFLVVPTENKVVINEFTPPGLSVEHFGAAAANPPLDSNGRRPVHTTTITYGADNNLFDFTEASTGTVLSDDLGGLDDNVVLGKKMLDSCKEQIAKNNGRGSGPSF